VLLLFHIQTNVCFEKISRLPLLTHHTVFSGGTDCFWRRYQVNGKLAREWDANTMPKKAATGNSAQLVNPAYVHAVAPSADGKSVAVALGDGRLVFANDGNDSCVVEAHSAAASTCTILDDKLKTFVVSGGNDSVVRVYRKRVRTRGPQRISLEHCGYYTHSAKVNFILGELAPTDWSGRLFIAGSTSGIAILRVATN
jgi:hypothetical protein